MERKNQPEHIMDYHLQFYGRNLIAEKGQNTSKKNTNAEFSLHVGRGPRWRLLHRRRQGMLVVCISEKEKETLKIEIETCNRS
jgi:hypothetical protein